MKQCSKAQNCDIGKIVLTIMFKNRTQQTNQDITTVIAASIGEMGGGGEAWHLLLRNFQTLVLPGVRLFFSNTLLQCFNPFLGEEKKREKWYNQRIIG